MTSLVQVANPSWTDGIWSLLMEMHRENGVAPLAEHKVRQTLDRALAGDMAIVGAIGTPDRVEASVGLFISKWWYSEENLMEDLWNFVHPDFRQSGHARALLAFSENVSKNLNIPMLMGVLSTKRTAAKARLYRRYLGSEPVGAIFLIGSTREIPRADDRSRCGSCGREAEAVPGGLWQTGRNGPDEWDRWDGLCAHCAATADSHFRKVPEAVALREGNLFRAAKRVSKKR